jgi:hypothetical protein
MLLVLMAIVFSLKTIYILLVEALTRKDKGKVIRVL